MKKILSIDGGGIRGLIPALVLAQIEKNTGKPIAQCFDLIAGTSTGGILALGLSCNDGYGKPRYAAGDLVKIYQERGREIFSRSLWHGVSSAGGVLDEVYSQQGLEKVLDDYFGEAVLGSLVGKALVTSYDIENRRPVFLKSWKPEHLQVKLKYAARATSAAPTYFEPAMVHVEGESRALVDGGVFINSPSVSAYAEAMRIFPDEKNFFMLSLGTGELIRPIPYQDAKDWGKAGWLLPVLSCMFDGVADAADYQMNMFLGDNYVRLQQRLEIASDDMDNATAGNLANLQTEAEELIRLRKADIEKVCGVVG